MKLKMMSLVTATALALSCGTPAYTDTSTSTGTGTNTGTTDSSTNTSTSTSSNAAYSVPADLQTSFTTQYPTATNATWSGYNAATVPVDWELNGWTPMDANGHTATFTMDNQQYNAWYDSKGTWVGSTYAVSDYTTLPPAINTMIKDKYAGYNIDKVQREMWKDRMAYEVKLKKTIVK